jgi:hypothetical protein
MMMLRIDAAHRRGIDDRAHTLSVASGLPVGPVTCGATILEVHAAATACSGGVLRLVGDDGLDGEEQRGDRGGVLQR